MNLLGLQQGQAHKVSSHPGGRLSFLTQSFADQISGLHPSIQLGFRKIFEQRLEQVSQGLIQYEKTRQITHWQQLGLKENLEERFQRLLAQHDFISYLLDKYPVWSRLVAQLESYLVRFAQEFSRHLKEDFGDLKKLVAVSGLGSDPHQGEKVALKVKFADGSYVYKPRSTDMDFYFQEYLRLLNNFRGTDYFQTLKVIRPPNRGWIEYYRPLALEEMEPEQRANHYEKVGSLLAVIYALAGVDFHYENLICGANGPVLVDLEGLMQPQLEKVSAVHTVLTTGFLPSVIWVDKSESEDQPPTDVSAIGRQHLKISPAAYAQDLIRGFKTTYLLQKKYRQAILKSEAFAGLRRSSHRLLFAHTHNYSQILKALTSAQLLASEDLWLRALDNLGLQNKEADCLLESERWDLGQLNIPLFWCEPMSRRIYNSKNQIVDRRIHRTGAEICTYRISRKMNEEDLERQLWFMRLSLECHCRSQMALQTFKCDQLESRTNFCVEFGDKASLEQTCLQIRHHLKRLIFPTGMKEPMVLEPVYENQTWMIRRVSASEATYQQVFAVLEWVDSKPYNRSIQRAHEIYHWVKETSSRGLREQAQGVQDISLGTGLCGQIFEHSLNGRDAEDEALGALIAQLLEQLKGSHRHFGLGFRTELVDVAKGLSGVLLTLAYYQTLLVQTKRGAQ